MMSLLCALWLLHLQVEVHRLVWFVGILSFVVAITLFAIGLGRNFHVPGGPLNAFVNGFILVVVANVPEVRREALQWLLQHSASFGWRSHSSCAVAQETVRRLRSPSSIPPGVFSAAALSSSGMFPCIMQALQRHAGTAAGTCMC